MKSKLIKGIIVGVVIVGICFGGYYGYTKVFASKTTTTTAQYYQVAAKKMNIEKTVQGTGAAYAATTKNIAPNNNGTLQDLNVKIGDTVTEGQTLFTSDSDELRKSVTTAQNDLAKKNLALQADQSAQKVDDNKIAQDNLSVSDANSQLVAAKNQLAKMTVASPIAGVVTAVNSANGDSITTQNPVLTVVDMSSMKIKISVDELDIQSIKVGQKSTIKFGAITDKTYEGAVESIGQVGTTTNDVTTYDVVIDITDPTGIKLGMNATVTISVDSKENALVIPSEALVEQDGKKYVRVQGSGDSTSSDNQAQASSEGSNNKSGNRTRNQGATSNSGNLVEIKTGLEANNYIEVLEGVTEGEQLLVKLPQTSTSTNSSGRSFNGNMGGNMNGNNSGGTQSGNNSGGSTSNQSQKSGNSSQKK
jgi:HlyD family secretion protein